MNKVLNINLGGYPFVIDDVAFQHLKSYLDALLRHFENSEGCDEIISDIENRMAELLTERLGSRQIVVYQDVQEAIKIMGTPEEFSGDEFAEEAISYQDQEYRTGKRLFRNSDDKVIGGVCSGLAAYFGIEDPVWIRIAFAVSFLGAGIGFIPYIILWAVVPLAKTSADKLAMRGKKIDVNNIAKNVEEELENLSDYPR